MHVGGCSPPCEVNEAVAEEGKKAQDDNDEDEPAEGRPNVALAGAEDQLRDLRAGATRKNGIVEELRQRHELERPRRADDVVHELPAAHLRDGDEQAREELQQREGDAREDLPDDHVRRDRRKQVAERDVVHHERDLAEGEHLRVVRVRVRGGGARWRRQSVAGGRHAVAQAGGWHALEQRNEGSVHV